MLLAVPEVSVDRSLALCSHRRHHTRVDVTWKGLMKKRKINDIFLCVCMGSCAGYWGKINRVNCQDLLRSPEHHKQAHHSLASDWKCQGPAWPLSSHTCAAYQGHKLCHILSACQICSRCPRSRRTRTAHSSWSWGRSTISAQRSCRSPRLLAASRYPWLRIKAGARRVSNSTPGWNTASLHVFAWQRNDCEQGWHASSERATTAQTVHISCD